VYFSAMTGKEGGCLVFGVQYQCPDLVPLPISDGGEGIFEQCKQGGF
jgi:hypothetical protein